MPVILCNEHAATRKNSCIQASLWFDAYLLVGKHVEWLVQRHSRLDIQAGWQPAGSRWTMGGSRVVVLLSIHVKDFRRGRPVAWNSWHIFPLYISTAHQHQADEGLPGYGYLLDICQDQLERAAI